MYEIDLVVEVAENGPQEEGDDDDDDDDVKLVYEKK